MHFLQSIITAKNFENQEPKDTHLERDEERKEERGAVAKEYSTFKIKEVGEEILSYEDEGISAGQ